MLLLNAQLFFGKFHPLVVHLPIGFLLLAVLLQLAGIFPRYKIVRSAVPLSLLAGCLSAILACITGYLLSLNGDYNPATLNSHMWTGIITAIVSFIAWLISIKTIPFLFWQSAKSLNIVSVIVALLIVVAGHYGGTLTHGSGYVSTDILFEKVKEKKKITNIEDALVFADIVQPILQNKCGSCHNNNKKKGQLSMETLALLKKGGKHGLVVKEGKPLESELVKRVLLNPKDEKFMPTDGKTPLTKEETAIIQWWIEKQMSETDQRLAASDPPPQVKQYIQQYLGTASLAATDSSASHKIGTIVRTPPVAASMLAELNKQGFVVKQISYNPDLLDITLPSSENNPKAGKIAALEQVKDNILWLNVAGNQVSDEQLSVIKNFSNLQRLRLDKNPVTDNGIKQLQSLSALESVNLCYTNISDSCLADLSKMKKLQKVYVWGTSVSPEKNTHTGQLQVISGSNEQNEASK